MKEGYKMQGEYFAFTGSLLSLSRKQAKALVYSLGGHNQNSVTKKTSFLVVGLSNVELLKEDNRSIKRKEAERLNNLGISIKIITESEFLSIASVEINKRICNGY